MPKGDPVGVPRAARIFSRVLEKAKNIKRVFGQMLTVMPEIYEDGWDAGFQAGLYAGARKAACRSCNGAWRVTIIAGNPHELECPFCHEMTGVYAE